MDYKPSNPFKTSGFLSVPTENYNNKLSPQPSPRSSSFQICDLQTDSCTDHQDIERYITYSDAPKEDFDFFLDLPYPSDISTNFQEDCRSKIGIDSSTLTLHNSSLPIAEENLERPIEEEKTQAGLEKVSTVNLKNQALPKMSRKEQVANRSKAKKII